MCAPLFGAGTPSRHGRGAPWPPWPRCSQIIPFEAWVTLDLPDDFHKRPFPSDFVTEMTKINKVPFYSPKTNNLSC